jgi:hypothetical protein
MSGGYIDKLDKHEHQLVIVTFKGPITSADADRWNQFLHDFKLRVGDNMIAVTLDGNETPKIFQT